MGAGGARHGRRPLHVCTFHFVFAKGCERCALTFRRLADGWCALSITSDTRGVVAPTVALADF